MAGDEHAFIVRDAIRDVLEDPRAAWDTYVTDDFLDHNPPAGPPTNDREALIGIFTTLRQAFPDLTLDVEDSLTDGDKVVIRAMWRGTHQGEFMGLPATGKSIAMESIHIFRVRDGRLAEHWAAQDTLGMMRQLGAIPS